MKTDYYYLDFLKFLDKIDFKNKNVLDIGCGSGDTTSELVKRGAKVSACDIIDGRKPGNKNSFSFNITKKDSLNFPDNFFDIVINFDVLEHVEDDLTFVNEMYRVLKPGGTAYVFTPNLFRIGRWLRTLATGKFPEFPMLLGKDELLGDCIHLREYTKRSIETLFNKSGFSKAQVKGFWLGLYHPVTVKYRIAQPPHLISFLSQTLVAKAEKPTVVVQ